MLRALAVLYLATLGVLASARIYPTYPVASTVLSAGRVNTILWKDDGKWPSLHEMGPVTISLYVGQTFVSMLAENVDAAGRSADCWVSPSWRHNGSDYFLLFTSKLPRTSAYSADFTLTGMAGNYPFGGPIIDEGNINKPSIVYMAPSATDSLPAVTSLTGLQPTLSLSPLATALPSGTSQPDPSSRSHSGAALLGLRKRPPVDLERLKFRFVFIFWPTIIGLTMAL